MRIIASIFFLTILLFNWFGYRFVMDYVQHKADTHFETKLDNKEYDETALLEIRVSVSLPYQTDWKEFERVSGEININGMHYKYVERKLEAGEMIYKCIPDTDKARLLNARENFFKLVNDLQTQPDKQSNKQPTHSYKTFSFDYCDKLTNWKFHPIESEVALRSTHATQALLETVIPSPVQPPDA